MPVLSGQSITVAWLLLPFLAAFLAALLPSLARPLALLCFLATAAQAAAISLGGVPTSFSLLGPHGVVLRPDAIAVPFLLLNALVAGAVLLDTWQRVLPGPFLLLLMVLHGGLDSTFVVSDLISLYVSLEVVGISAFLLILGIRSDRSLWVALRYLLISNTVMNLFLIGAAWVYLQQGSFHLEGLVSPSAAGALALVLVGLLTKSGLFLAGLWLPRTHAEAPSEVSALLSGVVVTAGLCPLLRITSATPGVTPVVVVIGLASAVMGILFALAESDVKRLLAWSTLSQLGLAALAPAVGGFYALAHGLAKAVLFLLARRFPSRELAGWTSRPLPQGVWWPLWIASLSIVGAPPLLGFLAKEQLAKAIPAPLGWTTTLIAVGTAAVYSRLWGASLAPPAAQVQAGAPLPPAPVAQEFPWSPGVVLLLAALLLLGIGSWSWNPALPLSLAKTALVVALALLLNRWLEPLRSQPWLRLPDLESFGDVLGCIALTGAALLVALHP